MEEVLDELQKLAEKYNKGDSIEKIRKKLETYLNYAIITKPLHTVVLNQSA